MENKKQTIIILCCFFLMIGLSGCVENIPGIDDIRDDEDNGTNDAENPDEQDQDGDNCYFEKLFKYPDTTLVVFPSCIFQPGVAYTIETIFSSVMDDLFYVGYKDNSGVWHSWVKDRPEIFNDIDYIEPGITYYVKVEETCTLIID